MFTKWLPKSFPFSMWDPIRSPSSTRRAYKRKIKEVDFPPYLLQKRDSSTRPEKSDFTKRDSSTESCPSRETLLRRISLCKSFRKESSANHCTMGHLCNRPPKSQGPISLPKEEPLASISSFSLLLLLPWSIFFFHFHFPVFFLFIYFLLIP